MRRQPCTWRSLAQFPTGRAPRTHRRDTDPRRALRSRKRPLVFSTTRPASSDGSTTACGNCRSRGRRERVHRSLETTERFPQLPQGILLPSDPAPLEGTERPRGRARGQVRAPRAGSLTPLPHCDTGNRALTGRHKAPPACRGDHRPKALLLLAVEGLVSAISHICEGWERSQTGETGGGQPRFRPAFPLLGPLFTMNALSGGRTKAGTGSSTRYQPSRGSHGTDRPADKANYAVPPLASARRSRNCRAVRMSIPSTEPSASR